MVLIGDSAWHPAPNTVPLPHNSIHVWCSSLSQPTSVREQMAGMLSEDERARAERFRFTKDRDAFIVGRGLLRTILARYLGNLPQQIQFEYGLWGKPEVAETIQGEKLEFNMSHSGDLVLIAVTLNRKVGIDIEWIARHSDTERIAERFFAPSEAMYLRTLSVHERHEAFFRLWTAKEAFVKAQGIGLSRNFAEFTISFLSNTDVAVTDIQGKPEEVSRWSLSTLAMDTDYVATLAAEHFQGNIYCWDWSK